MSCAYRTHRYRASVTACPVSVSWQSPTGHARHPMPLRPLVVYPHRQAVPETDTSADDAPIPVSLVQYLWAQWRQAPPEDRESVAWLVAKLMRSPRWHWDVTVLPDQSLPDPQHPFVSERDGQPTIGMPIAMLRTIWKQVVADVNQWFPTMRPTMPPIMQRFVSVTDPALWQEFWQEVCALRNRARRPTKRFLQHHLYGYLSPRRLPTMAHEIRRLLQSNAPNDRYTALTVLTQWLASPDHATRAVATRMLHGWPHVVAALVRSHPSDDAIRTMLERLAPTILTATRPEDRAAWVATLWEVVSDPIFDKQRRQMSANALKRMLIHDPMVAALVHERLRTMPLTHPAFHAPVWNSLLEGLMHTAVAGEVLEEILDAIAQAIRQDRRTIPQLEPVLAACWGTGHDQRILAMVTSHPDPSWREVLTMGLMTSVGAEVCAIIQSQVPPDQVVDRIVSHIRDREGRGDLPLAPLPAYLIPWVCEAARSHPEHLPANTIRRLWLADPDRAWDVTQTMLDSGHPTAQYTALTAMDAGWGTGYAAEVATTLRARILKRQDTLTSVTSEIATAVAGIGIAPPSLIEALLTELAMEGNEIDQRDLISALRRGWGRGQDALVMRVVAIIAERDPSERVWKNARATLTRAWRALPPHVVVSLIERLVTRAMNGLVNNEANDEECVRMVSMAEAAIAVFAPIWTHLPTPQVIERIAHHAAHLHEHARTLDPSIRDTLVAAWAQVIAAGAERLSASDIHAVLNPLWDISPHGCLTGIERWVHR